VYCKLVGLANVLYFLLFGSFTIFRKDDLLASLFSVPFGSELVITCCRLEKEELERAKEVDKKVVLDTRKEIEISRYGQKGRMEASTGKIRR
jgi:hypothetical protein